MKRSKTYLSGPMSGLPDYNYPEFHRVARILRKAGHDVFNPAESFAGDQGQPFTTYMRHDIEALLECDLIVLLEGWEQAVGANLEVAVAAALGHGILEYRDNPDDAGHTLSAVYPIFESDRDRLGFVLGTPVPTPELDPEPVKDRPIEAGDTVRVVNAGDTRLVEGALHTVDEVNGQFVIVDEGAWYAHRFERVEPTVTIKYLGAAVPPLSTPRLDAARVDTGISQETVDRIAHNMATAMGLRENLDTGEVRTISGTGGEKGVKLARFDLIPPGFLWALAEHFGVGARKYDDNNWQRGYEWSKSYGALQRHLFAWIAGEDIDAETGSSHLIAVAWHACVLHWFAANQPTYDDRPKGAA